MSSSNLLGSVDFFCQLTFQICGFVLVNYPTLGQFVDHAGNRRKGFFHLLATGCFEVTDRITGGFRVIFVTVPTLGGLTGIFFGRTVIGHEFVFKEGKGRLFEQFIQKNEVPLRVDG